LRRTLVALAVAVLAADARGQGSVPTLPGAPATPSVVGIGADSIALLVRRAQRMVNDGNGAEARAQLDSLLERTEPRSAQEAEVLFWRATLAESWETAQRDYLRLMLEHEGRPRAADAMLRLAQGEVVRGDRPAALRYLERLAREAPESGARAEAGLLEGRLLIERGARPEGCAALRRTRGRVAAGMIELENQYDFLLRGCPADVASGAPSGGAPIATTPPSSSTNTPPVAPQTTAPVVSPPAATPAVPPTSSPASPPATTTRPAPAPGAAAPATPSRDLLWSVQVAAFGTRAEAADFAEEVKTLGFDARVDGTAAPFRVRFGRFATRTEAQAAMTAYRTKARADAFLTQVPRG